MPHGGEHEPYPALAIEQEGYGSAGHAECLKPWQDIARPGVAEREADPLEAGHVVQREAGGWVQHDASHPHTTLLVQRIPPLDIAEREGTIGHPEEKENGGLGRELGGASADFRPGTSGCVEPICQAPGQSRDQEERCVPGEERRLGAA